MNGMNRLHSRTALVLAAGAISAIAALTIRVAQRAAAAAEPTGRVEAAVPSVPTLGQWGILLLLVAVISAGLWALSSRRHDRGSDR